jgi:putative uncharacterized protein (fragment)
MAKQTSMHLRPCKEIAEAHNYRCKELDYVRSKLSHKNENWMWDENKCLADRREEIRKLVKEKTGRKMQAKAVPLHEGVVVIDEYTTMEDLKELGKAFHNRFGCECIHISIHRDEGHWVDKEGYDVGLKPTDNPTEEQLNNGVTWKPNLHAHMVFDWYNHETGKSIRTSKQDARNMQTICAEVLNMERGRQSSKKHLDGLSFKLAEKNQEAREQEEYLDELENDINEAEEKLKKVDLRLSNSLKELSTTNSTLEDQKRLMSKKNDQLKQIEEGIALAKSFDNRISRAFNGADVENSLWGVGPLRAAAEECEKVKNEIETRCRRIEDIIEKAVDCIAGCITDMKRRAFSSSDVLTIDTALGKSRREERADYLLEAAEEKAEVKHGNYAGHAIWEHDLMAIARGEQVRTIDRGQGLRY